MGRRGFGAAVFAALLFAHASAPAVPSGVTGGPPPDYTKVEGLSQPLHATIREAFHVPMHDGNHLYVEVVRPEAPGPWPVVMEASPYHGTLADRDGIRIFPDARDAAGNQVGLTGYFAPRGYAVAMVDLRGTGRSEGCLDHLGPNDARDLKRIVEWAARQPWSNGRVGMLGHSYVGSTPSVAAAQKPRGLVTIVPSAGLASMYDHQFHNGVPWLSQWLGTMFAYEALAVGRDLVPGVDDPVFGYPWGDNFGNRPDQTACGAPSSSLTAGAGQLYGQYDEWHRARDWRVGALTAHIPVFMVHGVNDNAARIPAAAWFFGRRFGGPGDKVWIGQWDHGAQGVTTCPVPHPNCRFEQWKHALHAWFDRHLQGRAVDTGPPVEAFLNTGEVWTAPAWSKPAAALTLYADTLPSVLAARRPPSDDGMSFTAAPLPFDDHAAVFATGPLRESRLFVGQPSMLLRLSLTTSQAINLIATLYRQDADGDRHPMTHCAVQPLLRNGLDSPAPVVPGEVMDLRPQCFTMAHRVPAGERLVLEIDTLSEHHIPTHGTDARVTVHTGRTGTRIALPLVPDPVLYRDVLR